MTPQMPVNRLSSLRSGVSSHAVAPGAVERGRSSSSAASAARSSDGSAMAVKLERHGNWASLSRFQTQLARLQNADQAILGTYRELHGLLRQLEQAGGDSEALAAKVASLRQKLEQGGVLDSNMQLRARSTRASYVLDRVDLVATRGQSEKLNVQLPNGAGVRLELAAGASPEQNLHQLRQAFARHNLSVSLTDQGQLRLQGDAALLAGPWQFSGQGVRVPAGNPVSIQLGREPDELQRLEQGISKGERAHELRRIKELLATLERERRAVDSRRQQLLREIDRLSGRQVAAAPQAEQSSQMVRNSLVSGDFALQLSTLLAQANVSRSFVVALLGR